MDQAEIPPLKRSTKITVTETPPDATPDDARLFNRELSWLEFNRRVLDEAVDENVPILERLKFLAIFATNLDEFFMIRVSGIKERSKKGHELSPDGLTATERFARSVSVCGRC